MNIKSKNVLKTIFKIFCVLLGTFIMGCAYNLFYNPYDIVLGGFGGLSMLIVGWLEVVGVKIDMYVIYLLLNIVLFVFAVKLLGKSFAFYTLIGILSYSIFLPITNFVSAIEIPQDLLLSCLYGGVLTGLGVGLVIRVGGSTGGGDLLGSIANHYSRKMTVGNVSMAVNFIVVFLSILTYGIELSLYSIISIYISGIITDLIVEGPKSVKAYYIISNNYVEIANKIMTELGRGVTALFAEGMYTRNDQKVLLCIVYKHQIGRLNNIIYSIDKDAFVYSVAVNDAMGKGFSALTQNKNLIQKFTLKNNVKANSHYNNCKKQLVFKGSPNYGINVFDEDIKNDLNTTNVDLKNNKNLLNDNNKIIVKNINKKQKLSKAYKINKK